MNEDYLAAELKLLATVDSLSFEQCRELLKQQIGEHCNLIRSSQKLSAQMVKICAAADSQRNLLESVIRQNAFLMQGIGVILTEKKKSGMTLKLISLINEAAHRPDVLQAYQDLAKAVSDSAQEKVD